MAEHLARREFIALAGLLASCGRSGKPVIGVIPKGRAHLFWQSVHAGAVKAGRETGVDILWNGPTQETDYTGQLQIVESMINRRVAAIVLAPIDRTALDSVIDRAANEKIPVVIFDSGVQTSHYVAQVATDNFKAGQLAALRMGQILHGAGKVAMVKVQPGAASTEAREEGFKDGLKSRFPNIEIVDERFGMADFAKSLEVSENMLTAHPELDALFASNESSAVGASQALRARRGKVRLVGFDTSPTLLADVRSGLVDSLVVQDPFRMGYQSVLSAVAALHGKPVERNQPLPPLLIDKSNLDSPEVQAQLNPDLKKYLGG